MTHQRRRFVALKVTGASRLLLDLERELQKIDVSDALPYSRFDSAIAPV